jgi:hypothetical protein
MHHSSIVRASRTVQALAVALGLLLVAPASLSAQTALTFDVPTGWSTEPVASSMRFAQFALPRAEDDAEDGEVVVYYFQGAGGSVQANLDRWVGQMQHPSGRSSSVSAKTQESTVNGMAVTQMDVSGTYVAEVMPGQSQDRHNKPNYRLLAAVLETSAGPYFIKVTGPRDTIARWEASVEEFIGSMKMQ